MNSSMHHPDISYQISHHLFRNIESSMITLIQRMYKSVLKMFKRKFVFNMKICSVTRSRTQNSSAQRRQEKIGSRTKSCSVSSSSTQNSSAPKDAWRWRTRHELTGFLRNKRSEGQARRSLERCPPTSRSRQGRQGLVDGLVDAILDLRKHGERVRGTRTT